jgi:hypothetical protein
MLDVFEKNRLKSDFSGGADVFLFIIDKQGFHGCCSQPVEGQFIDLSLRFFYPFEAGKDRYVKHRVILFFEKFDGGSFGVGQNRGFAARLTGVNDGGGITKFKYNRVGIFLRQE